MTNRKPTVGHAKIFLRPLPDCMESNWMWMTMCPFTEKNSTIIAAKNAEICKGDRMVVFCKNNDILIKEFAHRTATTLVLSDIMDSRKTTEVNITDIALVSRIYWVSQ